MAKRGRRPQPRLSDGPWKRFVHCFEVPRNKDSIAPNAHTEVVSVEFILIEQSPDGKLKYLGDCPRCPEGEDEYIEVEARYEKGSTHIPAVESMCLNCDSRLDRLFEAAAKSTNKKKKLPSRGRPEATATPKVLKTTAELGAALAAEAKSASAEKSLTS